MTDKIKSLRREAMKLPLLPGVYIMKDERGTVIYVGKAKNLKNRVRQYFQSSRYHTPKVQAMVQKIDDFDIVLVDGEEATCKKIKKTPERAFFLL